jgi:hypothetical protein
LIGATVSFAAGGRGTFEDISSFLSSSSSFQAGYTAGVWDILPYLEPNDVTPEQISKTLNCMDHRTLGETTDWVARRLRTDEAKGTNMTVDTIFVYDAHPCTN